MRLDELPEIATVATLRGWLHLQSLATINSVLALGPQRAAVLAELERRSLSTAQALVIVGAIETHWQRATGGPGPWVKPLGLVGSHDPAAGAPGFLALAFDKLLKKELRAKMKAAGLRTVRELFDCAATPTMQWCNDARLACFRWLTSHGFDAGHANGDVGLCGGSWRRGILRHRLGRPGDRVEDLDRLAAPGRARKREAAAVSPAAQVDRAAADPATPADQVAATRYEAIELHIPLENIRTSKLNPRKTFDEVSLQELAESIKKVGILQPIVVRPTYKNFTNSYVEKETYWTGGVGAVTGPEAWPMMGYELVAGERRYRAAKLAGLDRIPARVHDLADKDVLEVMVIENEQRDDVAPLEKADGYAALLEHGHTVESLAAKVGKSTATIYGLLKLRDLPAAARKAVDEGKLATATAQLIARIPNEQLRAKATKEILDNCPHQWTHQKGAEPMSLRQAQAHLQTHYMVELKQAPFSRQRVNLVDGVGACTSCPKMTGNNRAAFPGARADMCTDPACYRTKVAAHNEERLARHRDAGYTVLEGKKADAFPQSDHMNLGRQCWEDPRGRTYKTLLKPALEAGALPVTVIVDPRTHEIEEFVPRGKATAWLQEHKLIPKRQLTSSHTASLKKHREADALRHATARLALERIVARLEQGVVATDARELRALVMATWREIWHETRKAILKRRNATPQGKDKFGSQDGMASTSWPGQPCSQQAAD